VTKRPNRKGSEKVQPADITGTWIRENSEEGPYPDELTFEADGVYSGWKAPGSPVASKLDVGVFDQIDEHSIRMSTATDRDETFLLHASEDQLKLIDEEGTELRYKRSEGEELGAPDDSTDADSTAHNEAVSDRRRDEWQP
jgi:hypothetical protein